MRENDIVFLNLHRKYLNQSADYGGFIGIYSLAAFVNDNGFQGQAFAGAFQEGLRIVDELCAQGLVKIFGLYCDYANVTENEYLSRYIKKKYHLPVLVGGPQASSLSEEFFVRSQCDAVGRYEGELTVMELMDYFLDGTGELSAIRGISYLKDGKVVSTPDRPPIENLDALPFIDEECYLKGRPVAEELSIMTGRGCPFHCAFCHEGSHTRRVRTRSVENVLAEIDAFLEAHLYLDYFYILFVDDALTLDEKRLRRLCEGLKERRERHHFHWFCEAHVHTLAMHPEMISMMADAGVLRIQLGIESGCSEVLEAYHKNTTPEEIKKVVGLCRDAGIQQIFGNIILGSAFFSEQTYERDLAFGKELQALGRGTVELGVVSYWPLPQTEISNNPEKFGLAVTDYDFYTSADDFAQTTAPGFSTWDILARVQAMTHAFAVQRKEMILSGSVPFSRMLSWLKERNAFRGYGTWFQTMYQLVQVRNCCEMVASGEAVKSLDEFTVWTQAHPMRVLSLAYQTELKEDGTALFDENLLTHEEMEIMSLCTGRLSAQGILDYMSAHGRTIAPEELKKTLLSFESKYLIVYSREEE